MALDPIKNFAKVTVSTTYDASATSIVLSSGHGAYLPQPSGTAFNLVWWNFGAYPDPSDDPNVEIVRCTARSTDTLTVTRAQEGTTASTKNTGGGLYKMILAFTKKTFDEIAPLNSPTFITPTLGTPVSGNLSNCSSLPLTGLTPSTVIPLVVGSIELGANSDTTIERVSAGVISVEGVNVVLASRSISTTGPISGGGDLSTNRTITTSMATNRLIGRGTAGTGVMEEIILGTNLSLSGTTLNASGGGGGLTWSVVTADASFTVDTGTIANKGTLLTMTLPGTSAVGKVIRIAGMNAGLWKIAQNASQNIKFGNATTATGTGGYISSTLTYDCVELLCVVADTTWVVTSSVGSITIV